MTDDDVAYLFPAGLTDDIRACHNCRESRDGGTLNAEFWWRDGESLIAICEDHATRISIFRTSSTNKKAQADHA